jgi:uncharacterized cupin superfamily protein
MAAALAAELAETLVVEISGATGLPASLNGFYERTDQVKNGKPVFAKKMADGSEWDVGLWEGPDGRWWVSDREDIDANLTRLAGGRLATLRVGVSHPALPGTVWMMYDGTKVMVQEAITVRIVTAADDVS